MKHALQITSVAIFILFAAMSEASDASGGRATGINMSLKAYQK